VAKWSGKLAAGCEGGFTAGGLAWPR